MEALIRFRRVGVGGDVGDWGGGVGREFCGGFENVTGLVVERFEL